jgi:hypothetical protein
LKVSSTCEVIAVGSGPRCLLDLVYLFSCFQYVYARSFSDEPEVSPSFFVGGRNVR